MPEDLRTTLPPGRYAATLWDGHEYSVEKRCDGTWHLTDGTGWSEPLRPSETIVDATPWQEMRA